MKINGVAVWHPVGNFEDNFEDIYFKDTSKFVAGLVVTTPNLVDAYRMLALIRSVHIGYYIKAQ